MFVLKHAELIMNHNIDPRNGKFVVEGQEYKLTLLDLPCVVETHKTLDMRSYYKSGDIGQVNYYDK